MLTRKNIILGITGSIAVYKVGELISKLKAKEINIEVIMTKNAQEFVTPLTFQTLSCNMVYTNIFKSEIYNPQHIALASKADLMIIVPATANIIGKICHGIADDLLTTTILAISVSKVLIVPAMNTRMYKNPIVKRNIQELKNLGYKFIAPEKGKLACQEEGKGRLASIDKIIVQVEKMLK